MGKIDIDYNILHDAFFKHQKKPKLTQHGDMYFEGKESEIKKSDLKPGRMSAALCEALGIPESAPPPWIMNMQRYGPPPAYPNLKIPGVNIPIPASIQQDDLGQGGLFKDENGLTVYADCHGLNKAIYEKRQQKKKHWGEIDLQEEEEEEPSEYDSEDEEIDEDDQFLPSDDEQEDFAEPEFAVPKNLYSDIGQSISKEDAVDYKPSFEDLKSGISSLISGAQTTQQQTIDIMKKPEQQ